MEQVTLVDCDESPFTGRFCMNGDRRVEFKWTPPTIKKLGIMDSREI